MLTTEMITMTAAILYPETKYNGLETEADRMKWSVQKAKRLWKEVLRQEHKE